MDPSSSSSSSHMSRSNYDVFLSFRGPDTRHTIVSHLHHSLCEKGVRTFHDRKELKSGDRREKLFEAIEGSRIAIVLFSENYARSRWCLNELSKIMELQKLDKLRVLPIFYHVSPREVRLHEKDNGERGCYQIAIEEMEEKYGRDSRTVKRWRNALWLGGDLIGIPLSQGQDENAVVQDTLKTVLKILNRVPLEVAEYPVGIDRHLVAVKKLLRIDPHVNDVYILGLLGQGGVGKTTLSKAICNDIAGRFDSWCFLPNIRERASGVINGLEHLQLILLRDLLSEEGLMVTSVDQGKRLIEDRLSKKRVLVILDDVDEWIQFNALAGNLNWFGKGSRIIITTRNNRILTLGRVQHIYNVQLLSKKEAIDLFRLHAFGEMQGEVNIHQELIDRFMNYAGELPLALEVLGRFLRGRSENEWRGKLKELADSPDTTINSILKISFKGLEEKHKEIFLYVACFFKGWNVSDVEKILDSCGFATSLGINILVERCLATVVLGKIQMHDLLKEMGQSIIRGERIWLYDDFLDILSEDSERQELVKGIVLNFFEEKVAPFEPNAFRGFKNLRVLIVRNVAGTIEPLWLPRNITWLQWQRYSASAIEFASSSKLVGLDLEGSQIRQIKGTGFRDLNYVNLSRCILLDMLPDLSKSLMLEDLNLHSCKNLTRLDEAVGDLENLVHLDLSGCYELVTVPSSLRSKKFQTLNFRECSKLCKFPAIKEELHFLEKLDLTATAIKELPDSFGNLVAVKELSLSGCKELTTIPSSIYNLRALERLYLKQCGELSRFPRNAPEAATDVLGFPNLISMHISNCKLKDLEFLNDLTCFKTLKELDLGRNEFAHVPACMSKFNNLEFLRLNHCNLLVEVSELPSVSVLSVSSCARLKIFPSLHTFIGQTRKWFGWDLSNCHGLDLGYIHRSLPLEKVRQFVGAANVVCPGEEFPHWVNFQSAECDSHYQVSLPEDMSTKDVSGLALFVTFNRVAHFRVFVMVGNVRMFTESDGEVSVHTWFLYIPRKSVGEYTGKMGWRKFILKFSGQRTGLQSWGMRLLCKEMQDDCRINVSKVGDNGSDSSGSEYTSALESISETDYESEQSE